MDVFKLTETKETTGIQPIETENSNLSTRQQRLEKVRKKAGQPMKYQNPEDLDKAIQSYFEDCKNNQVEVYDKSSQSVVKMNEPLIPTIAGLAYAIGMDRMSVYNYEENELFFDIIKKARDYIFSLIERKAINSNSNQGGLIFIAKNYGYTDKQEIELGVKKVLLD